MLHKPCSTCVTNIYLAKKLFSTSFINQTMSSFPFFMVKLRRTCQETALEIDESVEDDHRFSIGSSNICLQL